MLTWFAGQVWPELSWSQNDCIRKVPDLSGPDLAQVRQLYELP